MTSGSAERQRVVSLHCARRQHKSTLTVVLTDRGSSRDVILDLVKGTNSSSVKVHDGTRGLDQVALSTGTSGQTLSQELFVLAHEVLQLSFLSSQSVKLVDVELA
jgi:hypothetical protein